MSDSHVRKKLIEVSIPLDAINAASAREKSIRHGHPSTLHLWWARRPLAACRAVLFAQLVDDPSAWPDRFPTEEAQAAERKRLHRVIDRLVPWEASNNEEILNAARWEIARSVAWGRGEEPPDAEDGAAILAYLQAKAPPVYDPFSGGGSIPLEAQRLGLRAYGSDLNPVAVLIGKALVEIPPRFADRPPVNSEARAEARNGELRGWKGAQGLAEDVRYYGAWMCDEAARRIGHLYPKATLADGSQATVIAWLWARTVRSPDPAAKGAMVPLLSTFLLSIKEGKKTWVEPLIDPAAPDGYRFKVCTGTISEAEEERLKQGTKTGRGQFRCLVSGAPLSDDFIRVSTAEGLGAWRPFALVAEDARGKRFLPAECAPVPEVPEVLLGEAPSQTLFAGALGFRLPAYGLHKWADFFRPRQIAALTVFSGLIVEARDRAASDASTTGFAGENYGDAIAAFLLCCLGRAVDYWTINTMWEPGGGFVIHTFSEMTIPIVWDSAEANPFVDGGGGWDKTCLDWVVRVLANLPTPVGPGHILNVAAQDISPETGTVFSTDPPYFDNIGYADLSDAFFVWQRKPLGQIFPDLGRRLSTPKDVELVATSARHGGPKAARDFFLSGMRTVFRRMISSSGSCPVSIFYSFKEKGRVGAGSGWESFLEAIIQPGWQIDAAWPLKTERPTRNRSINKNALASSIVLVCRKRDPSAATVERDTFVRALRRELPAALAQIRAGGVGPVDMAQAAIGPGIGVFTRYAAVLEDSGAPMTVRTALALINQARDESDNDEDASYDLETRFALDWFSESGWEANESGRAILAANARNLSLDGLIHAGLIRTQGGKTRLIGRDEMPTNYDPMFDKAPIVWKAAQHVARALTTEDGGQDKAAAIMAHLTGREAVRALAFRLYGLCDRKSWSAEALVWNRVAEEWRAIEDRADTTSRAAAGLPDLFTAAR